LILLGAAALTGCVRYHPRPLDPTRSEELFRARKLDDPGLRAFLRRPGWPPARLGLNDLTAIALYFNSDLDVARAQFKTAQARTISAKARSYPTLSVGGGWTDSPESPLVFHFDPSFTLETAGKRGLRVLQAQKEAEAARLALAEIAWRIRSRVRSAWLDYVLAEHLLEALRNEDDIRQEIVAILERRLSVGEESQPTVNLARAALVVTGLETRAAETRVRESAALLASAVGMPALSNIDTESLPVPPSSISVERTQKAGLLHRLDIRRSLLEYAAAEARLHLEIANQYPNLQLGPGYGFDEGHHKITFGPTLPVPLINRNRGPIAEAEGLRTEAEARFNWLQAKAIGEMQAALAAFQGALSELADADRRLTSLQKTREAEVRRAFAVGEEDRLAVAQVRLEAASAARTNLEILRRAESALGALEDAVQQPLEPGPPLPDPEAKP
jgi:cobalt-zinc-cadmium efflux system outer membrane protein